jgi:hypothetical protein
MTLYDFNKLDLNGKMQAVNQYGIFIENYITTSERCNLYNIDGKEKFFAEVVYNPSTNKITKINSFKTGHLLDKYSGDV